MQLFEARLVSLIIVSLRRLSEKKISMRRALREESVFTQLSTHIYSLYI
jgi:hypothetical protein